MRVLTPVFALVLLALLSASAPAATHQVGQSGFSFLPADLTIEVGDTVEWVWGGGIHTVTHGTDDLNPPQEDKLFDEPLTTDNPIVSYTFTEPGEYPYYCRPHLIVGMVGTVTVEGATPVPFGVESEVWSRVKGLYR
jgi:plastocyanin